jgi:hypothetical protein
VTCRRLPFRWVFALPLACLAASAGCGLEAGPTYNRPAPTDDPIVAIRQFYPTRPWLRDTDDRVIGFTARAYFVSGETDRGQFVPGTISVVMNLLRPRAGGGYVRERLHEWTFDEQQARGFRITRPSILGESYGFVLRWPETLNVMGCPIEVVFYYGRTDDRIIAGPPRQLRVELPPGYTAPPECRRLVPADEPPATRRARPRDGRPRD